jgi:NAD(P)-dependent dehydrogenase (short-subunit alcohol dehydrogenase family)
VQAALGAFGGIDLLCNVAGILRIHTVAETTVEDWNRFVAINLSARNGNVVNVASGGRVHRPSLYGRKCRHQSRARQPHQVACDEICARSDPDQRAGPGGMRTPMADGAEFPPNVDRTMRYFAFWPPSAPEDIVEPLFFLASDRARTVHGMPRCR